MPSKQILTKKDIERVADLIKIKLKSEEVESYQKQLNSVLDYLEVFKELDTKDTKITSQITGLTNVLREDESQDGLSQDDALLNAHEKKNGYFVVKKVL